MLPWPDLTPAEWRETVRRRRALGGAGSGNFGHAGRPGEVGGSVAGAAKAAKAELKKAAREAERAKQTALAAAQTNPLAHPPFVLGMQDSDAIRYVGAYGEAFTSAPLPKDIDRAPFKECYKNVSLLVMQREDLDYAEGFATNHGTGEMVFQHAWAVTKDGTVVDPTWDEPEKAKYFGIRYDRASYLKYLYSAKIYGVLGSTEKNVRAAIETGGNGLLPSRSLAAHDGDTVTQDEATSTTGMPVDAATQEMLRQLLLDTVLKSAGGVGSGNFGHAGRPGERGGSGVSGGGFTGKIVGDPKAVKIVREALNNLPVNLQRDVKADKILCYTNGRESSDAINDYLEKTYGVTTNSQVRSLVDQERGLLMTAAKTPKDVYDQIPHLLSDAEKLFGMSYQEKMSEIITNMARAGDPLGLLVDAPPMVLNKLREWGWIAAEADVKRGNAMHSVRVAVDTSGADMALILTFEDGHVERIEPEALRRDAGGAGSGNFGHAGRPGEVGGSGAGGASAKSGEWESHGGFENTGITWKQDVDPKTGRPIPIHVKTVEEAVSLVLDGKVVEVEDVRAAHTLIAKLGDMAREAKAKGEDAPEFDLCQVTVPGSSMFCAESLRSEAYPQGVPRLEMPQLGGAPVPGSEADKLPRNPWDPSEVDGSEKFISHLQGIGVKTSREVIPAANLRASQRELVGTKVAKMMVDKSFDPAKNPIFISSDNYVVDGHHRWAAVVGRDAENGVLGDAMMNAVRVNAPIAEVLHLANAWSQKFGIKQAVGVTKQAKATGLQKKAA